VDRQPACRQAGRESVSLFLEQSLMELCLRNLHIDD
jgi:hypothetical protein